MSWDFNYVSGTPNLDAGDITDLDGAAALSMHTWCRLEDDTQDHHTLGKDDGTNGLRMYYETSGTNGKVKIPKLLMTIGGTAVRAEGGTDNVFTTNTWHSFGASWKPNDAAGATVWMNGSLEGSGSTTAHGGATTFPNLAANLYVGRRGSTSVCWDGQIGEVAIWDEELVADDWAALAAGVPAFQVRPWALLFWSAMRSTAANEWFWRPMADATGSFTHSGANVTYSSQEPPQGAAPYWEDVGEDFLSGSASNWSTWTKIVDPVTISEHTVTGLTNGLGYQFKVRAVDTSGNPSSDSDVVDVTPTASASGPPLVPPYARGRLWVPLKSIRDDDEFFGD